MDSDCPDCAEDPEQENQISNDSPSPEVTNSGIVVPPGFVVIPYPNVNRTAVFDSLPHDVICMIASDLAIFYQNGFINAWKEWVDEHVRLGRKLYMIDFAAEQVTRNGAKYGITIPECCQVLKYEPKVPEDKLQKVLEEVVAALCVDCDCFAWRMGSLQVDLQAAAVAGYVFDHADPSQLTEVDRASSRVVYMSSKVHVFGEYLRFAKQREILAAVIRDNGLGRLIPCRFIFYFYGNWEDLF